MRLCCDKLRRIATSTREREWLSKVRVVGTTQPLLPPRINDGVLEEVGMALYANCWLEVDYNNGSGERSRKGVMPLGLAQQGARLYLVGRYKGYGNESSLALHRIVSARASTLTFEPPGDFELQKYDWWLAGFGDQVSHVRRKKSPSAMSPARLENPMGESVIAMSPPDSRHK